MLPAVLLRSVRATPAILTVLLGAAACTGDTPTATPSSRALPALRDMISAGASDILASSLPLAFSPAAMSAGVGDTLHFTAVGTTLSDPSVLLYWYSSDASIASVEPWTGKITANAMGSVTIYAAAQTTGYAVASGQLTIGAAVPKTTQPATTVPSTTAPMAVFPSAIALGVGDTTRLAASGTKVTANVAVYWYSGNTAVATVEPWTGKVTATGIGTTQIFGAAQTTDYPLASATVTVGAAGSVPASTTPTSTTPTSPTVETTTPVTQPSSMIAAAAELPRAYVSLSVPTPTRTISVPAGGDLQGALNSAQPGDVLLLAAGATYVGNFVLPAKASSGWITVRTSAPDASLPASGVRISPSYAAQMPKILTYTSAPAIATARGAANWRLLGLEIGATASVPYLYDIVALGDGSGSAQSSLSQVPTNLIVERSWVHGAPEMDVRRCIALNSASTAIVDSYLSDCHGNQGDSQAIYGWNGPGPYKITNNYLEGGHEVLGFGGPTPGIYGLIPSDIEVRRNHVTRPLSWRGRWGAKNLFECKSCQRVLIEGNVFENNWVDQQNGFAIVLQGLTDGGDALWNRIWDVTIRSNIIRNTAQGISLLSRVSYGGALPTNPSQRITITNNLLLLGDAGTYPSDRRQINLLQDLYDITVSNNTFGGDGVVSNMVFDGSPTTRLSLVGNVFGPASYGLVGNGTMGAGTLLRYAPQGQTQANAFVGLSSTSMPAGNWFPATLADAGLLGTYSGDWSISSSGLLGSILRANAVGVNYTALNSATTGVVR